MNTADKLAAALRNLPDDVSMIEHNPDEGPSYFCCGEEVQFHKHPSRGSGFVHSPDCWYMEARAALAEYDSSVPPTTTEGVSPDGT